MVLTRSEAMARREDTGEQQRNRDKVPADLSVSSPVTTNTESYDECETLPQEIVPTVGEMGESSRQQGPGFL